MSDKSLRKCSPPRGTDAGVDDGERVRLQVHGFRDGELVRPLVALEIRETPGRDLHRGTAWR